MSYSHARAKKCLLFCSSEQRYLFFVGPLTAPVSKEGYAHVRCQSADSANIAPKPARTPSPEWSRGGVGFGSPGRLPESSGTLWESSGTLQESSGTLWGGDEEVMMR